MGCDETCWTPVICSVCGLEVMPWGRSVGLAAASAYCHWSELCDPSQRDEASRRHLWDEHDDAKWFVDPDGWRDHIASCDRCRREDGA